MKAIAAWQHYPHRKTHFSAQRETSCWFRIINTSSAVGSAAGTGLSATVDVKRGTLVNQSRTRYESTELLQLRGKSKARSVGHVMDVLIIVLMVLQLTLQAVALWKA